MDDPFWSGFDALTPKQQYLTIFTHPAVRRFILFILPLAIVFLLWCRASVRLIRCFCRWVFRVDLSREKIQAIIAEKGAYLGRMNAALDQKAGEHIEHMDVDCTWKGRARKVFGAICKKSHYLIALDWVKAEGKAALAPIFHKMKSLCFNLKVIYADLAKVFTTYLPHFFRWVAVKACNVHADRALQRALARLAKAARKLARTLKKIRQELARAKGALKLARKKCYNKRSYVKNLRTERTEMYKGAGLRVTPSGTLADRRKGVPPEIREYSTRIQFHEARLHQLEKTQVRWEQKVAQLESKCRELREEYQKENAPVLHGFGLEREFWKILHDPNPRRQLGSVARFMDKLARDAHAIASKIYELFETCLPLLGTTFLPERYRLAPSKENTNDIENFWGQFRAYLEAWRNVPNTPYLQSCFEIIRAFHNILGPRSGFNEGCGPVTVLGLNCDVVNVMAHLCTPPKGSTLVPEIFLPSPHVATAA